MSIDISRFRATFLEEAVEHLATMEAGLLRMDEGQADADLLNEIFRAAHSIKGGAGMFGFPELAQLTHVIESLLDEYRGGTRRPTSGAVDVLLRATDMLKALLASDTPAALKDEALVIQKALEEIASSSPAAGTGDALPVAEAAPPRAVRILFVPSIETFRHGLDPALLLRDLADVGTISAVAFDGDHVPALTDLDPEACHLAWRVTLVTQASADEIRDVFLFASDGTVLEVEEPASPAIEVAGAGPLAAAPASVAGATAAATSAPEPSSAPERRGGDDRRKTKNLEGGWLRVSTDKVDRLVDLVGELVIAQSMIADAIEHFTPARIEQLRQASAELARNTRELQERVMAVRMVPVATIFQRAPRLARDLARDLGKSVIVELRGEETELDRSMIEQLGDPLTHLIRNAVDHAIEPPDARVAAGKPAEGTVCLSARTQGGSVFIEVADDGRGLNRERILAKAISRGVVAPDETLSDEQVYALIFHAGLSTAEQVSGVSGRGVGMDVVKRNVEALGGAIAIQSRPGLGATFTIKLPLTLAILDGQVLALGEQVFVLPLVSIVESLRPRREELKTLAGGRSELVMVRGDSLPLIRLHRLLGVDTAVSDPASALVVIVEHEGRRAALMVEELLGQQQVVVKSLDTHFNRTEGVMGATIMGDGRVALILDVPGLVRLADAGRATLAA